MAEKDEKGPGLPLDLTEFPQIADRAFLNDNPEWLAARERVNGSPDAVAWDSLVVLTEQLLVKYPSPSQTIKDVITITFDELLTKFPLFFGYWKKYTSLQYQINGLEESLKVLSRSLEAFPASLELWIDYLTILISHTQDKGKVRMEFETAAKEVGNQFLSHTLWDKYIEWEQSEKNMTGVMRILLRVIRVPLHQYARYYQQFTTLKETIALVQLQELDPAIGNDPSVINDHYSQVFLSTQTLVGTIWPYESQMKQTYFTLAPVAQDEVDNWNAYLDLLIQRYATDPTPLNRALVISLFERALVPTANSVKFWYKYLGWSLENFPQEFEVLDNIYKRAIDVFVPISYTELRVNYALFLEYQRKDNDRVEEVLLNLIRQNPLKPEPVSELVKFIARSKVDYLETAKWLDTVVTKFYDHSKSDFAIERLVSLLNDRTVVVVLVELISMNWYQLKNHSNVKKYLADFSRYEQLSGSTPFWTLNYRYNKQQKDYAALEHVVAFVKDKSTLPLTTINAILLDYADLLPRQTPRSLSTQTTYLAVNALEYEVAHPLSSRIEADEQWSKKQRLQSGHPAVYINKPHINNSTIDSKVSQTEPSSLPMFKNVEKANAKIVYTEEE